MRFWSIILVFCFALAPVSRAADPSPLKTLMTGNDSRGWEAVGRLNIAGRAFCTGALIAPNLVLTAAHCLFDHENGRRFRPSEIEFLAGWRNGRANARATIRRAIAHPKFQYSGDNRTTRVSYDLALLELTQPIRKTSVKPFQTAVRPRKGAEVGVVSYARDRAESPSLQEVCHVLARRSGTLVLSCDVDFGSSGAPIFTMGEDGRARIVSVVSAKAEVKGRDVALGTSLEKPLSDLMEILATTPEEKQTTSGVRVLKLGNSQSGAGAKFVRP